MSGKENLLTKGLTKRKKQCIIVVLNSYIARSPAARRRSSTSADKAAIKPKALHEIKHNTDKAREEWGISSKPKIIVVSEDEMPDVLGRYDPVENTVYYMTRITEPQIRESTGGESTVELHEMWHMKQAEKFRTAGWKITTENRGEYIKAL